MVNKKMQIAQTKLLPVALIVGLTIFSGCSNNMNFSGQVLDAKQNTANSPSTSSSVPPVTTPITPPAPPTCQLQSVTVPVKILFVVDTSGSNNSPTTDNGTLSCGLFQTCAPATDPYKSLRSGSITNFFAQYSSKPNFSWGFEVFSNDGGQAYITSGATQSPSFSNANAMQSAINQFNAETDGGGTPYIAALSMAQSTLATDADINSTAVNAPLYYVIFLSDGYPTDSLNSDGTVNQAPVNKSISQLINLAPGRVFVSTVYYGTINDPVASGLLQSMAQVGKGQFLNVDTTTTSTININDLITVPSGQCAP
jgi:hypothetical protein